jgi:acylphosphatase
MTGTVARRVHVEGRVQGVFFRDSCQREARARGVAGWVTNDADGGVTAWFEGAPDAVDALVDWCREGPPRAKVARVDVETVDAGGLTDFTVR